VAHKDQQDQQDPLVLMELPVLQGFLDQRGQRGHKGQPDHTVAVEAVLRGQQVHRDQPDHKGQRALLGGLQDQPDHKGQRALLVVGEGAPRTRRTAPRAAPSLTRDRLRSRRR